LKIERSRAREWGGAGGVASFITNDEQLSFQQNRGCFFPYAGYAFKELVMKCHATELGNLSVPNVSI